MQFLSTKFLLWLNILLLVLTNTGTAKTNSNKNVVLNDIADLKEFKKLLRTKNNVLTLFVSGSKEAINAIKVFRDAAELIRGTGTMLLIDCAHADRKKLCKKLKVTPEPYVIKHYKDGDFHKDYERQLTVSAMLNFMRDPAGELPWEEDPAGADVIHFADYNTFTKHLRKDSRPMLIMFYVPWCGYCKRLKPDFSKAATELKSQGYVLAAMDVERQENAKARRAYNITGFPTILYFEGGELKQTYEGENNKDGIVAFMKNPNSVPAHKPKEDDWSADPNSEIVHLTTQNFEPAINDEPSVLIMFYAPWCGHCNRMKPEYEKAAVLIREQQVAGVLAALDATKEPSIAEKYKVKGYPTVKYFINGQFKYDVNIRDAVKIVEFMKDPKEPPPPPPPEKSWEDDENTEVLFLNDEIFIPTLKRKKHVLVMFYAPWCGHCKSTKPEYEAAAHFLKDEPRSIFAAVDCTRYTNVCQTQEIRGYPTIKYYSYLKTKLDYNGGRKRQDFIEFMTNRINGRDEL